MTEVDFYILPDEAPAARDHFACRLAEKAMLMGRHIIVAVNNKDHAESMSQYLWSFKPESFVPHRLADQRASNVNIVLDWQLEDQQVNTKSGEVANHDVLINLRDEIPAVFSRFQRLSEIVVQQAELLTITRSHYQFYRERGYPLKSHKIEA